MEKSHHNLLGMIFIFSVVVCMVSGLMAQDIQFKQTDDDLGLVVFEVEDYAEQFIPDVAFWVEFDAPGEASNDQGMQSYTDSPFADAASALTSSAILTYYIEFVKSDTVYLWYRAYHVDGGDDSFHAGLDGEIPTNLEKIAFTGEDHKENWTWQSWLMNKHRPRVYVDAGVHAFHLFQRESELIMDKIVLTTDVEYDPELFSGDIFGPDVTPATGVESHAGNLQNKRFDLAQNFPNPFNPSTYIDYELFEAGQIHLSIYNTAGQEMDVLVDAYQNAGVYRVNWNAGNLANGVYFYKLETAGFSQTKKLLLQK